MRVNKIIEVNEYNEVEIEKMDSVSRLDYFIQLQNHIVQNLDPKQRLEYQKEIQEIPMDELRRKIKYASTWREKAERNLTIKKKLKWVEDYFPEESVNIKRDMMFRFEEDRLFFVISKVTKLKKVLPLKQENKITNLKDNLRKLVDNDTYLLIIEKLGDIETLEKKIGFLNRITHRKKVGKYLF